MKVRSRATPRVNTSKAASFRKVQKISNNYMEVDINLVIKDTTCDSMIVIIFLKKMNDSVFHINSSHADNTET